MAIQTSSLPARGKPAALVLLLSLFRTIAAVAVSAGSNAPANKAPVMLQFGARLAQKSLQAATSSGEGSCDISQWSNVRRDCGGCRALVSDMHNWGRFGGTCEQYCAAQGRQCVAQQEDIDDTCSAEWTGSCSAPGKQHGSSTGDLICTCGAELPDHAVMSPSEPAQEMTVLSWNVLWTNFNTGGGHAWQRRQLADVMVNTMHADLAGLQECMNEDEMAAGFAGRMRKAPGTDVFNCIFYKPGVVEFLGISGRRYLGDYASDAYSQRYVSYAKMRFAGVDFWLFSTHWCIHNDCVGHQAGLRHRHSAQVITTLREELGGRDMPAIITADTNSHMDGLNNDDGIVWLLGHGFDIAHQGSWPFDVIFVSTGDWHVTARIDGPTYPSDHPSLSVKVSPVAATTTVTTTTVTTTAKVTTVTTTTSTASTAALPRAVQAGDTIWLRAHTSKYLTVEGTEVHAKWNDRDTWQAFVIEKEAPKNLNIQSGDTIYLRAHTERLVTVQGTTVHATWDNMGSWERFVIEKNGAGGHIYPNDTIYLRAHTGKYLSVEGTTVHATWGNQGSWEALRIERDDAADGMPQETGYTGADNKTSWEYFEGYNCYPGNGAEDIAGKSPVSKALSLQDCRVACEKEPTCEGIVMLRDRSRDQCWLRKNVDISRCTQSTPYDSWLLDKNVLVQ